MSFAFLNLALFLFPLIHQRFICASGRRISEFKFFRANDKLLSVSCQCNLRGKTVTVS